ncbi:glycosyltransferase [Rhodocaloribacter sp.]
MPAPRLTLFNLYSSGHHPEHIAHLVRAWRRAGSEEVLEVAAPERLRARHPALAGCDAPNIRWVYLPEMSDELPLVQRARLHGQILRSYVMRHRPAHVSLMYYDHAQPALAFSLRFPFPVHFSGILFRPTLHYASWAPGRRRGFTVRLQDLRKRFLLRQALRNPHFHTLFSLDPLAVPFIEKHLRPPCRVVALPDPLDPAPPRRSPETLRAGLGIAPGRRVFLFFGVLSERKGLASLIEALSRLDPATARHTCIVFAGQLTTPALREALQRLQQHPDLQIIVQDSFIPYEDVQDYFHMADIILAPYQQHVGSSGILIRAAAAERPVLSQDYGLMGRLTETLRLGLTANTTSPTDLAEKLAICVHQPLHTLFEVTSARRFASENTVEAFVQTIFSHVLAQETGSSPGSPAVPAF